MNETQLTTVAQLSAFLNGTLAVEFRPLDEDGKRYPFIVAVLKLQAQNYSLQRAQAAGSSLVSN